MEPMVYWAYINHKDAICVVSRVLRRSSARQCECNGHNRFLHRLAIEHDSNYFIVNHDLANAIQQASGSIELRNEQGELLGYVSRLSPADLAKSGEISEAIERANSDGPWYTTAEVQKHLEQIVT